MNKSSLYVFKHIRSNEHTTEEKIAALKAMAYLPLPGSVTRYEMQEALRWVVSNFKLSEKE